MCHHAVKREIRTLTGLTRAVVMNQMFHDVIIQTACTKRLLILPVPQAGSNNLSLLWFVYGKVLIRAYSVLAMKNVLPQQIGVL